MLIEYVLGPIQDKESDGAKANFDVDEEVQQAASTLIADMTIEPRADVEVKGQVVEVEGYENNNFKNCIVNTHQRIAQNVLLQVTFLQTKRFHQNTILQNTNIGQYIQGTNTYVK